MRVSRALLAAAGLLALAYGLYNLLADPGGHPVGQLVFLAALLAGHDLLLLPAALGVGALASRLLPGWARGAAHAALFASAVVALIALPFIVGTGHPADNPSALPLDYRRGLLIVLAAIWAGAATAAALTRWRRTGG